MFVFPYRTTTPLSHFPSATIALMAIQVLLHAAELSGFFDSTGLQLAHGKGLHPLQWITSNFIHGGGVHLLGNMVFLWIFGQITEGRLGWWRFLLVYLGIGVTECALEQTMLLDSTVVDSSSGASAVIYGLMIMSVVWAPWKTIYFAWFAWFIVLYHGTFEVSTMTLALVFVIIEVLLAWLGAGMEITVSGPLLHLLGAGIGLIPAVLLLKMHVVEEDGHDLLSWWDRRRSRPPRDVPSAEKKDEAVAPDAKQFAVEQRKTALHFLRGYLEEGDPRLALMVYEDTASETGSWDLPEPELRLLIRELQRVQAWPEVKPLMMECIRRFPDGSEAVKILLARLLIEVDRRPRKGAQILRSLEHGNLPKSQAALRTLLLEKAEKMYDEGSLEFDLGDEV